MGKNAVYFLTQRTLDSFYWLCVILSLFTINFILIDVGFPHVHMMLFIVVNLASVCNVCYGYVDV